MGMVNVVIIDDDSGIRKIMAVVLEEAGLNFKMAADGLTGIKVVSEFRPALAVVDVKLGTMNGVDVARKINALGFGTKIMFVTGYVGDLEGHIHGLPVVGIMEKPFDIFKFTRMVKDNVSETTGNIGTYVE